MAILSDSQGMNSTERIHDTPFAKKENKISVFSCIFEAASCVANSFEIEANN